MKAKIISFDEVLERIKTGDVSDICVVNLFYGDFQDLSTMEVGSLMQNREDNIFIQTELDGEQYELDKCKR